MHFLDYVQAVAETIFKKYIKYSKKMVFNDEDKKVFDNATSCHICSKPFNTVIVRMKRLVTCVSINLISLFGIIAILSG